jgi:hypothetical protein
MLYLLGILFLVSQARSEAIIAKVLFNYQSQGTTLPQWFELFTLCLAPLVAHVAGGVSSTTLTGGSSEAPNWSARITHFNPISIIWRYYIIVDRRVRARSWDEYDMAACNAVFWDGERAQWDGSEEIMVKSRAWITKVPEKRHIPLLSASSVVSLVLTLQGVQATFLIVASMDPASGYRIGQGLAYVFLPLGCLGLIRLPAALWLSSDYGYLNVSDLTEGDVNAGLLDMEKVLSERVAKGHAADRQLGTDTKDRLLPAYCWRGILYRIWWIFTVTALLGVSAASCSRMWWGYTAEVPYNTLSRLIFQAMYFALTISGVLIHSTYVLMGRTRSTLIPCISSTWYKVFTILMMAAFLVCAVVAALETRRLRSGTFTTLPELYCKKAGTPCIPVGQGQGNTNI